MNHGAGPLCLRGQLGGEKKEMIYWNKGKDQEKEGVRKFCVRDKSPAACLK